MARQIFKRKVDRAFGKRQRMAERNRVGGALCRHDARNTRDTEHIALCCRTGTDGFVDRLAHIDAAACSGFTVRFFLAAHVHHDGGSSLVKMRQSLIRHLVPPFFL